MVLLVIQIFIVMSVAVISAILHHDYFTAAFVILAAFMFGVYFNKYY